MIKTQNKIQHLRPFLLEVIVTLIRYCLLMEKQLFTANQTCSRPFVKLSHNQSRCSDFFFLCCSKVGFSPSPHQKAPFSGEKKHQLRHNFWKTGCVKRHKETDCEKLYDELH